MDAIKIIAVPPGEAPQQVREAWVGLVLPLALPIKRRGLGTGVLTGPKTLLTRVLWRLTGRYTRTVGYLVESAVAVSLLSQQHPAAAQWWRQNTPEFLEAGRLFMFAAEVCEEVPLTVWPPAPDMGEAVPEAPSGPLQVVFSSYSSPEAYIVREMLEDNGMRCFLTRHFLEAAGSPLPGFTGGLKVMVQRSDAAQAVELLREPFPEEQGEPLA